MADITGITNLNSNSNGSSSLTGIQAAATSLDTLKQEKGSGVTGNIPTFGSGNVLGDSGKVAPSGTIVGTSDTQALTNKTLTSPVITNKSSTGTDSGAEILTNKTIAGGSNTISGITEAMQTLADNTTANVSTSAHGYAPKAPNDSTKFLNGVGAYAIPSLASTPNWVDEGTLTWAAETTDKTFSIVNTGKKLYKAIISLYDATSNGEIDMQFNTDTGSHYFNVLNSGSGLASSVTTKFKLVVIAGGNTAQIGGEILITNSLNTENASIGANLMPLSSTILVNGVWEQTAALTSITILVNGNTVTGTVHFYSLNP